MREYEEKMAGAMMRIVWGYFLVLLDIKLMIFDVLPDWLGYYLIFSALTVLAEKEYGFRRLQPLVLVLIASAVGDTIYTMILNWQQYQHFWAVSGSVADVPALTLAQVVGYVRAVLDLALFGLLLKCSAGLAEREGNAKVAASGRHFSKLFLQRFLPVYVLVTCTQQGLLLLGRESLVVDRAYNLTSFFVLVLYMLAIVTMAGMRYNLYGQTLIGTDKREQSGNESL